MLAIAMALVFTVAVAADWVSTETNKGYGGSGYSSGTGWVKYTYHFAGIDEEVFDERYILAGAGISGVKGEFLRAQIAFAMAKREFGDASSYNRIIPVVESLASSDNTSIAVNAHYLRAKSLIEQGNYEKAIEPIMSLLELAASSAEFGYGWASGTAHGFASQLILHGQIVLAQDILDKYVEYGVKAGWNIFELAKENLINSEYFHAIKLYEYIYQNAKDKETKALCEYAIACCYDMIARESIDSSKWYRTDDQKEAARNEALKQYKTFIAKYPTSRYASWANHYSQFLAAYPVTPKPQNATAPPEAFEKQAGEIASDVRKVLRSKRPQWTEMQIETYAKNVREAFRDTLYRGMTKEEYNNFRNGFMEYCESSLPETLNSVDELAIEVATIRWVVRQYVSRLDLSNEVTEAAVDWQVQQLIQQFDAFIAID
jgi:hypothetical protein